MSAIRCATSCDAGDVHETSLFQRTGRRSPPKVSRPIVPGHWTPSRQKANFRLQAQELDRVQKLIAGDFAATVRP